MTIIFQKITSFYLKKNIFHAAFIKEKWRKLYPDFVVIADSDYANTRELPEG